MFTHTTGKMANSISVSNTPESNKIKAGYYF